MPVSEAKKRANAAYISKTETIYVRTNIQGEKARFEAAARKLGKSLNQFALDAMRRDAAETEK